MPLSGIRVVELATGVPGPYCGRLLAGFGAEVIKAEPSGGDPARREGPFPGDVPDPERSGLFLHLNTGKASVVLDLPGGLGRLGELLEKADLLVVGWRPRELAAHGLDLADLSRRYPSLIITSVTPFGLSGPYADFAGDELITYALSGYMSLTGDPDREPIKAYGSLVGYQAGAHAAAASLAALHARRFTGRGQIVDVSAMEAGTFMLGGVDQRAYFYGQVLKRNGTRLTGVPPQQPYPSTIRPCRDGYVHAHSNNRYRELLAALVPSPRLLDPDLLLNMYAHADEIDRILDDWLKDRDRREIVRQAQELRLPFTEVLEPGEVMAEEHHRERRSFVVIDHPGAGPVRQPTGPIRMSETPWRDRPAPVLGSGGGEFLGPRAAASATAVPPNRRPLGGVRVVDFTTTVAGPLATCVLGDLGAEVIKVEAPNARPLHAAGTAPLRPGSEDRGYDRVMSYNMLNHGKLGISLDSTTPRGRELLLDLVRAADVIVQNFSPRSMDNMRLRYDDLRAVNPDIVMVSMPAFGLDGPLRNRTSYGPGIDAMSGFSHLTGYADGPPGKPGNFFCDQNAAVHTAFATMVALWHRARIGQGQHVELAMIEGEFQILGDAYIDYAMNGRERRREGNAHPWMAPHGVFPCLGDDVWVAVAVEDDAQWRALCGAMARPDLASDPGLATASGRRAAGRALDESIAAWTRRHAPYEAQGILQSVGVPAGAVLTALDLHRDRHVLQRNGFEYVDAPGVGATPYARVAFRMGGTPVPIAKAAPTFAEDNDYVFGAILGLTPAEIAALEAERVTSRVPLSG